MKIFLIGPDSENFKGGIAQFTTQLAKTLFSSGHEVKLISWKRMYPQFLLGKRKSIDNFSRDKLLFENYARYLDCLNPFSWIKLLIELKKNNVRVLLINWVHPFHSYIFIPIILFIKLFLKVKVYFICHNVLPHESFPFVKFIASITLSLSDRIIVHSSSQKETAKSLLRKNHEIILSLMPVFKVSENDKEVLPIENFKYKILFFGVIRYYKGVDILIEAFSSVLESMPQLELLVVGEKFNKDSKKLIDNVDLLIEKYNIQGSAKYINDFVPNEDIASYFEQCDVAVYPYRETSQSASLTLAYNYNRPVLASNIQSFRDVVIEGESGYLFDNTSENLAVSLFQFYNRDPKELSFSKIKDKLSWSKYVDNIV